MGARRSADASASSANPPPAGHRLELIPGRLRDLGGNLRQPLNRTRHGEAMSSVWPGHQCRWQESSASGSLASRRPGRVPSSPALVLRRVVDSVVGLRQPQLDAVMLQRGAIAVYCLFRASFSVSGVASLLVSACATGKAPPGGCRAGPGVHGVGGVLILLI